MTQLPDLAAKCLGKGVDSLDAPEQTALYQLFLKEARKGAFKATEGDASTIRGAFCQHVVQHFGLSSLLLTVIDCLPYFRRTAVERRDEDVPLGSLFLYAAWVEHWINVLITMAMLRKGATDHQVAEYFDCQPRFDAKVQRVRDLSNSELPAKEFDWLNQIMKTRNRYHHYPWQGRPLAKIKSDFKYFAALVKNGERMIDGLLDFEHLEFDAPFVQTAMAVFPLANTR